jgi:hypothetical protein
VSWTAFVGSAASKWNINGAYSGPAISNESLANGRSREAYSVQFSAVAAGSVTWSATAALPQGMTLSASGLFSGKPIASGVYVVSVRVTDAANLSSERTYSWTVEPGAQGDWTRIARSSDAWNRIPRT